MNDGIVDSARQLLTTHTSDGDPSGALAGIIVGDHGDVIGHYDRQQRLTAGSILNHGFFRSGSGFGDRQFFELWGHVARHIAAVAEGRTTVRTRKSADRL